MWPWCTSLRFGFSFRFWGFGGLPWFSSQDSTHLATSNIGVSGQAMPSPDRVNWQVPRTVGVSKPLIGTRPIHERWIDLSGNWGS